MTYEEKLAKARKLRELLWGKTQPKTDSSETESDDKSDSNGDKSESDNNESE